MIFKSSEIRWFAVEKEGLWKAYESLEEKGAGFEEESKTDRYLRSRLFSTGVKFSDGTYDIKIKSAADRDFKDHGVIEHWTKWRMEAEKTLKEEVGEWLLEDWVQVEKKRYKKTYRIRKGSLQYTSKNDLDEGYTAEFTKIHLPSRELTVYSFALDAFSAAGHTNDNLSLALQQLDLDFSAFNNLHSFGYPELLGRLERDRFLDAE